MKYNLDWLIDKFDTGENIKYIFFWSHKNDDNEITKSCLSQWYDSKVKTDHFLLIIPNLIHCTEEVK